MQEKKKREKRETNHPSSFDPLEFIEIDVVDANWTNAETPVFQIK